MKVFRQERQYDTASDTDVLDLTADAQAAVEAAEVEDGLLLVAVAGSTASITTIEYESGAVADLKRVLEELAPRDGEYRHNLRWGDGNGYSHVRAALMGPSVSFPVAGGRILVGTWQQIVLCDFDNRPRRRRVLFQMMG
jgi:secondary thiamine-phosphate synthase enzyme